MAERTDVLIVTALQDELEAVLELGESGRGGWEEARDLGGFRYHRRTLPGERGASIHVAAAWIGEMGERATAMRVLPLIAELAPACLAMCGICAGRRGEVSLGDVIVADRLYSYDHGKLLAHKEGQPVDFIHDIKTYNLEETWKMDAAFLARELDLRALAEERPPSREAQRWWLLHTLEAHETESGLSPLKHPERKAKCPGWTDQVKRLLRDGLVERKGGELGLTALGREHVAEARVLYPDGPPPDPRFRVHVGAVATGKTVQEDPGLFDRLRHLVRATIGVEMEGVAIGDLGERFKKRAIVVKAVSDHADGDKDDSFRAFACSASAVFLMAFLQKHLDQVMSEALSPSPLQDPVPGDDGDPSRRKEHSFEDRTDSFLARVERVAALRAPKAVILRRPAPAPFSGVLEVSEQDGPLVKVQPIVVLDQPITEALVTRFITEIEGSYREQSPLLSILVHTGSPAPTELARTAYRRGVVLKSFAE
jgi:nucleoside phosphorylase